MRRVHNDFVEMRREIYAARSTTKKRALTGPAFSHKSNLPFTVLDPRAKCHRDLKSLDLKFRDSNRGLWCLDWSILDSLSLHSAMRPD
jgi:hypothetical protein